jgi:hypothetical protein
MGSRRNVSQIPAVAAKERVRMPNPFEGRWAVQFFELRSEQGSGLGFPFGERAQLAITTVGEALHARILQPEGEARAHQPSPVFEGRWQGGDAASMSARWVDGAQGLVYQLVAVAEAPQLIGGYFRVAGVRKPGPDADSDGVGSWLGTGPILPLEPERG